MVGAGPGDDAVLARLATGVPGFDTILHGGLLRGGVYLTEGLPGAGKSIFANQLAFAHVTAGGKCVYLTLLTETHARMLAHLRALSFFNADVVGDALYYLSGFQTLEREGLSGLLDFARHAVREHRATLLVIDGVTTAAELVGSGISLRRFVQELQLYIEALGCTAVLLSRPGDPTGNPEHTMVDGIFELRNQRSGAYVERVVEVTKFRGSGYLRGSHSYDISHDGLVVHPRTEALYSGALNHSTDGLCPFGSARLDAMLGGGLPTGSTTLVFGGPGSGKTILGLHFLAHGAAEGERGLYFGFHEAPARLIAKAERLGFALEGMASDGPIVLHRDPPREFGLDAMAERLLALIDRHAPRRLVIDGLYGFQRAALDPSRLERFWPALVGELHRRGVTTLTTLELPEFFGPVSAVPLTGVSEVTDAILFLRTVEFHSHLRRLITVMKLRDAGTDGAVREFVIRDGGFEVTEPFSGVESVLTGVARPLGGTGDGGMAFPE